MPVNCHRCKELISDQESHCPFCGAPQKTERAARVMTRGLFGDPNNILSLDCGHQYFHVRLQRRSKHRCRLFDGKWSLWAGLS